MENERDSLSGTAWNKPKWSRIVTSTINEARVEDVHRSPVHTGATRSISIGCSAIVVREGEEEFVETNHEVANESVASKSATLRRFFVGRENTEVIGYCSAQLTKLIDLVARCEEQYPNEAN